MISIIVPIYNSAGTLDKCVKSILAQEYTDFELILIDDGSTDNSLSICRHYSESDARVKTCHQSNSGVSAARNLGLSYAVGEWITFIDSDDYVEPTFLRSLLPSDETDFVLAPANHEGLDYNFPSCIDRESGAKYIPQLLQSKLVQGPWAKLYKHSIISGYNLSFDSKMRMGEDTTFVWEYLSCVSVISIVSDGDYIFTGLWGGDFDKYKLSLEEVEYLVKKKLGCIRSIQSSWGVVIDDYSLAWNISHLDGLLTDYTDEQMYDKFCSLVCPILREQYFRDLRLSQILSSILRIKNFYVTGQSARGLSMMKDMHHYVTVTASETPVYRTNKLIFYFVKSGLFRTADLVLRLLSRFIKL